MIETRRVTIKFRKGGGKKGKIRLRGSLAGDRECKGESNTNGEIPRKLIIGYIFSDAFSQQLWSA